MVQFLQFAETRFYGPRLLCVGDCPMNIPTLKLAGSVEWMSFAFMGFLFSCSTNFRERSLKTAAKIRLCVSFPHQSLLVFMTSCFCIAFRVMNFLQLNPWIIRTYPSFSHWCHLWIRTFFWYECNLCFFLPVPCFHSVTFNLCPYLKTVSRKWPVAESWFFCTEIWQSLPFTLNI